MEAGASGGRDAIMWTLIESFGELIGEFVTRRDDELRLRMAMRPFPGAWLHDEHVAPAEDAIYLRGRDGLKGRRGYPLLRLEPETGAIAARGVTAVMGTHMTWLGGCGVLAVLGDYGAGFYDAETLETLWELVGVFPMSGLAAGAEISFDPARRYAALNVGDLRLARWVVETGGGRVLAGLTDHWSHWP